MKKKWKNQNCPLVISDNTIITRFFWFFLPTFSQLFPKKFPRNSHFYRFHNHSVNLAKAATIFKATIKQDAANTTQAINFTITLKTSNNFISSIFKAPTTFLTI